MNSGSRRRMVLAPVLAALLVLSGCGSDRVVTRGDGPSPTSAGSTGPVSTPTASASGLRQARQAAGIPDCEPSEAAAAPGGLPEVTLPCLGSDRSVAMAGLRGPLVINVWAQWCGPCRKEAPILAEVSEQARGKVAFLGVVYADPRLDYSVEFARQAGWDYPQVVDSEQQLKLPLRIAGPPRTILVDADGRIVDQLPAELGSADQLRERIRTKLGVDLD